MNRREFCEYFDIPYRTVTDWEAGKRSMPEYVFRLMEYKANKYDDGTYAVDIHMVKLLT